LLDLTGSARYLPGDLVWPGLAQPMGVSQQLGTLPTTSAQYHLARGGDRLA
jgi:hypothetical protein